MDKENIVFPEPQAPTKRMTRSQAAAIRASSGLEVPLESMSLLDGKSQPRHCSSKRMAPADGDPCLLNINTKKKKQAVLKDVTNVICDRSNMGCIPAIKMKGKDSKKVKDNTRIKHPGSVDVREAGESQDVPETLSKENVAVEILKPVDGPILSEDFGNSIGDQQLELKGLGNPLVANQKMSPEKPFRTVISTNQVNNMNSEELARLGIVDIDYDKRNPLLCGVYASVIYARHRKLEGKRRPAENYMSVVQKDITPVMRAVLVDWLVEVCEVYNLVPDTLYLAIYIIDMYLSGNLIDRNLLQLVGITCMLIASKYEEIWVPRVEEICALTENAFTKEQVRTMEISILKHLSFQLSFPTTKTFLRRYVRAALASFQMDPVLAMEVVACYLAELTLLDCDFLKYAPSLVAASAVFLAKWSLEPSLECWNCTLEYYTGYSRRDLRESVLRIHNLHLKYRSHERLKVICDKYSKEKYKCVASLRFPRPVNSIFN